MLRIPDKYRDFYRPLINILDIFPGNRKITRVARFSASPGYSGSGKFLGISIIIPAGGSVRGAPASIVCQRKLAIPVLLFLLRYSDVQNVGARLSTFLKFFF